MKQIPMLLLSCVIACGLFACGPEAPSVTHALERPAEVHGAPEEADLSTVTLTERAVQRLGIETVAVERRSIPRTRTLGGELIVPPGRSVTVTAPVAGSLTAPAGGALPAPGTLLRQEQEVLRLFPIGPPENDLVQREAEARARFEVASSRAKRAEQLLRDRAGSRKDTEDARSALAIAEAALAAVKNQLRTLGDAAGDGGAWSMKTPLRGRLGKIHVAVGQTVTASTPLFEVIAEHPLWVRVPIYVGDLPFVTPEQDATVKQLGASSSWRPPDPGSSNGGDPVSASRSVTPVLAPPSADPHSATVDLFYRLDNQDGAYQPGQKVAVTIGMNSNGETEESLVVPYASVVFDIHGGTWVYENPSPRQYVRRRVEMRRVVGDQAVLSRGPAPNTRVVSVGTAEMFGTEFGVGH